MISRGRKTPVTRSWPDGIFAGAVVASCIFLNCWPKRKPSLRHHNQPFNTSRSARFLGIFDKNIELIVMLIVRVHKILDTRFGRMLAPLCQPGALLVRVRAIKTPHREQRASSCSLRRANDYLIGFLKRQTSDHLTPYVLSKGPGIANSTSSTLND